MLAGAVATLGLGPLLLVVLALGGTWGSRLTALRPYQPHFSPFLSLFAVASRRLYTRLETCAVGEAYSVHSVPHRQSIIF